jgi:dCMP deaminase
MTRLIIESEKKWEQRFLELAHTVSTWSRDPSTKVGAVVATDDNRILSLGFNGFPKGVDDDESRYANKELKYKLVCHAERNALDNANFNLSGALLYSTLFTCNECAKSVIQRGIKAVISPRPDFDNDKYNWKEALTMYKEAGVHVRFVDTSSNP